MKRRVGLMLFCDNPNERSVECVASYKQWERLTTTTRRDIKKDVEWTRRYNTKHAISNPPP